MFWRGTGDRQFFALLADSAQTIAEGAQEFSRITAEPERAGEYASRLKDLEKRGDRCTHDLIALLNRLFITPLDREDILTLAVKLDDVTDGLEAAAARIHLYRIRDRNPYLQEFARLIAAQAQEIVAAVQNLQEKKYDALRENAVRINELENQGDELLRRALEDLFEHETNPTTIIKLKEIYETLETVTDQAEDVANALETVVMRNA